MERVQIALNIVFMDLCSTNGNYLLTAYHINPSLPHNMQNSLHIYNNYIAHILYILAHNNANCIV